MPSEQVSASKAQRLGKSPQLLMFRFPSTAGEAAADSSVRLHAGEAAAPRCRPARYRRQALRCTALRLRHCTALRLPHCTAVRLRH